MLDDGTLPDLATNSGRATRFLDQCGLFGVSQHVVAQKYGTECTRFGIGERSPAGGNTA